LASLANPCVQPRSVFADGYRLFLSSSPQGRAGDIGAKGNKFIRDSPFPAAVSNNSSTDIQLPGVFQIKLKIKKIAFNIAPFAQVGPEDFSTGD
jgi:hypothetical protein